MLYPIKIEFKDYPSGSWQDWSIYLLEPPVISKKVESENEGEAGAIVFDTANIKLKYDPSSPVFDAFSGDLSVKQRYVFRVSAPKSDKSYVQLFEGMADFSTLLWLEYRKIVSIDIIDKLSAFNILQNRPVRTLHTIKDSSAGHLPWITPLNYAAGEYYTISIGVNPTVIIDVRKHLSPNFTPVHVNVGSITPVISAGTILRQIRSDGDRFLFARSQFYAEGSFPGENDTWIESTSDSDDISGTYRIDSSESEAYLLSNPAIKLKYYKDEFYSGNICNTSYYWDPDDGQWKTEVTSFKGEAMLRLLVKEAWSDISVTFRGVTTFNLPYTYWRQTMDENPFNKTPLEALILLANTMKCYVFIDKTGNCTVQSKAYLTTSGTARTITTTKIIRGDQEKYFWDKLVDGIQINVLSWVVDEELGVNLVGTSEMTKQPAGFTATQKIKPKNQIKKDILAGSKDTDTQAKLDAYAAQEALSILNFYGLRHRAFDLILDLDDNTIEWELIDTLILNSMQTFFTRLEFDCAERTVTLEPVEIEGHDYDLRSIVVGSPEDSTGSIAYGSTTGGTPGGSGVSYAFNIPLVISGGIVSLNYNNTNLKLTSNQLNTIQDIATTSSPTFNQLTLSSAGTTTNNAVRADRLISTSYPLTGGGNLTADRTLGLGYNSTNLKLTSNQLNTIQDIATTSSPTFNQLTLSSAGTTTNNAVRADRLISTSYPLTGGGNLTADRTLGLGYNTTNLKLTSNQLNTIQDIATTSSPTFATPNFTSGYNIRYGGNNYGYAKVVSNYFVLENNQVYLQWNKPPIHVGAVIKVTLFHYGESVSNQGIISKLFYIDWRNDGTINTQESEVTDVIGRIYDYTGYIGNFEVYDTDKLRLLIAKPSVGNRSYQVMLEIFSHRADYWQNYTISSPTTLTAPVVRTYRYYNSRLGLGITQPTEMLDVNGNIKAQTAKLTNLSDGYLPYHSSDGVGLVNSPIYSDATKVGIGTTTLSEAFNLQGHFKQTGSYSIYNNFTSGWAGSGWRMDYNISNPSVSTLELDDLWVRGSLNVYELIINQIRATNGSLFVSSCGKIATVNSPTSITLEDPDGHNIAPFIKGDIILIQRVKLDSTTITKRIVREVESVTNMTLTLITLPDGPSDTGALEEGDVLVRIGSTSVSSRRGSLYLTSDDSNAPYIDTINDVASWTDWTSKAKLKVRIGKLSGITSDNFGSLSDYGLYAKGGVYIEGSGSNSIALKVDSSSAYFNMKQSGNNVFEFNTATATAKIAGWNFNNSKMWANNLPSFYFLEMNGSGSYPYLYAGYGITPYADDTGVTFGRIPDGLPNSGSIGIMGYSSYYNETYFVLTDTKRSIAGWDFDGQKLYNATNIVLDGYNKKVSVNNDAVKMYYTDASNYGLKDSADKFQLGSTNQIAGWVFTTSSLSKGTDIVLDSANKKISVNNDAVQMYYSSGANYGLKDSAGKFQLGSTNQIAGWAFDTEKFSKNDVRIEATSSLKGMAVKDGADDIVRVGDFTNAALSYYTTNLTTLPDVENDWVTVENTYSYQFGWITMGYQFGSTDDVDNYYKSQFKIYLPLNVAATEGKTIEIKFKIAEQETSSGDEKITPVWAWIETDKGKTNLQNITPTGGVHTIGSPITYENRTITANIPTDITFVKFYIAWYKNINTPWVPASVLLNDWSFKYYNKTMTELNKKGLTITKSPIAQIKMTSDETVFNTSDVKVSNALEIGDWSLSTEPYLEGDGVTMDNRLVLKYKNVPKGAFKSSDGTYYTL